MAMFWFLVAIVFLGIWLSERSARRQEQDAVRKDGYRHALEGVRAQLVKKGESTEDIDRLIEVKAESQQFVAPPTYDMSHPSDSEPAFTLPAGVQPLTDAPQVVSAPQPALTKKDKEAQTIRNLNTILYVASFLIVAATALFVTFTMPPLIKLAGILFAMISFYTAGLLLHVYSARLRSASIAFVGTGLAIVPFLGFALTMLGNFSNESAWVITSLVGLITYAVAAVRLQSQLVSYITIAFVLSLALSAVSVLGLAVMWYFIAIIGVSLVFDCLRVLLPDRLPKTFSRPLGDAGLIVTPVALIASLFAMPAMSMLMYIALFALSTARYLVVWLLERNSVYEVAARGLAHITALLVVVELTSGMGGQSRLMWFGAVWMGLAVLQALYSLARVRRDQPEQRVREMAIFATAISLLGVSIFFWAALERPHVWMAVNLSLIGAVCAAAAYRLRQVEWLYGALAVSVPLVLVLGRGVIEPHLPFEVLAGVFVALGLVGLVGLGHVGSRPKQSSLQLLLGVGVVGYAGMAVLCGLVTAAEVTIGWTTAVAAGMLVVVSYLLRQVWLELVGVLLLVGSVGAWVSLLLPHQDWVLLVAVVLSTGLLGLGSGIHHALQQPRRRDYLAVTSVALFMGVIVAGLAGTQSVQQAAILLLLVGGAAGLVVRSVVARRRGTLRQLSVVSYITYPLLALLLGATLGGGWLALSLLVAAAVSWIGSFLEERPGAIWAGNIAFVLAVAVGWRWLEFSGLWAMHGVMWIGAVVFGLLYWLARSKEDIPRQRAAFWSLLGVLALASAHGLGVVNDQVVIASAGSLLALATVVALHGYLRQSNTYLEVAAYIATLGAQWAVSIALPGVSMLVYAHWWAITVFLFALWRRDENARLIIALGLVTAASGYYALTSSGGYALLFLFEHLTMAIVGAVLRRQWVMWWGVGASVLAVLYFLRDYTFLALLFLGFLLILFVVWRLLKMGKK